MRRLGTVAAFFGPILVSLIAPQILAWNLQHGWLALTVILVAISLLIVAITGTYGVNCVVEFVEKWIPGGEWVHAILSIIASGFLIAGYITLGSWVVDLQLRLFWQ